MITIIFPTMWKFDRFLDFLEDLISHQSVGEIIIIDNDSKNRPKKKILEQSKINILDFGKNIYTNAAWNEGVKAAKFDKLCICNDDVIFDLRMLRKAEDHITSELGVMGLSVMPWYENVNEGTIKIKKYENAADGQWGFFLCFFMHKSKYQPIPNSLKLYFGDNFIYDNCLFNQYLIKVIKDIWFYTPTGGGVTTKTLSEEELSNLNINDALEYKKILLSKGIENPYHWTPSIKMILEKFAPHLV